MFTCIYNAGRLLIHLIHFSLFHNLLDSDMDFLSCEGTKAGNVTQASTIFCILCFSQRRKNTEIQQLWKEHSCLSTSDLFWLSLYWGRRCNSFHTHSPSLPSIFLSVKAVNLHHSLCSQAGVSYNLAIHVYAVL